MFRQGLSTLRLAKCVSHTYWQRSVLRAATAPTKAATGTVQFWPSMVKWCALNPRKYGQLGQEISDCGSPAELLELVAKDEHMKYVEKNPDILTVIFRNILFKQLVIMGFQKPYKHFLQEDLFLAIEQIHSESHHIDRVFGSLEDNPTFKLLKNKLHESTESISDDCKQELVFLMRMSCKTSHDPTVYKIYLSARRALETCSLEGCFMFLAASRGMITQFRDYHAYRVVANRLKKDIEKGSSTLTDTQNLAILFLCRSIRKLLSDSTLTLITRQIAEIYSTSNLRTDSYMLWVIGDVMSKLYENSAQPHSDKAILEKCLMHLNIQLAEKHPDLTSLEIGGLQRAVGKFQNELSQKFARKPVRLGQQATLILRKEPELKDLVNIARTVAYDSSDELKDFWTRLFTREVRKNGLHLLSFDTLHTNVICFVLYNERVPQDVQHHIEMFFVDVLSKKPLPETNLLHADSIVFASKRITNLIEERLQWDQGLQNYNFLCFVALLLKTGAEPLKEDIFNKVLRVLPNCNAVDLLRVLATADMEACDYKTIQILRVQQCVRDTIVAKIDTYNFVELLNFYWRFSQVNVPGHKKPFQNWLRQRMFEMMNTQIIPHEMMRRTLTFQYFESDFQPAFIDTFARSLSAFASLGSEQQTDAMLEQLLRVCSYFGYKPDGWRLLQELVLDAYHRLKTDENYLGCIHILQKLTLLGIFPTTELAELFTLESIKKIKAYIETQDRDDAVLTEFKFAMLNRTVAIDFPQLNIPWLFEGRFVRDGPVGERPQQNFAPIELPRKAWDIRGALISMVNGKRYVHLAEITKYDYVIGIQIALDEQNQPLPIGDSDYAFTGKEKRICIMITNQVAENRRRLTGNTPLRVRHLKKLGYTVKVIIPRDLGSMSLGSLQSRESFLYTLIYGSKMAKKNGKYHMLADKALDPINDLVFL